MSAQAPIVEPAASIERGDLRKQPNGKFLYSDEAAVRIAMEDLATWDNYVQVNDWATRWSDSDRLYQSPQSISPWKQGAGPSVSVPNFMLSNALDAIIPKIVGGLTYEDPMFLLRPRPDTGQDIIDAKTAVGAYQLEDMNWTETLDDGMFENGLLGTVIFKWGWHQGTKKYRNFKRLAEPETITSPVGFTTVVHTEDSDAIEFEMVEKEVHRPYIEKKELGRVGFDPACKICNIQKAKWTVERAYADWYDLAELRELPDYDIPSKEVLLEWFFRDNKTAAPDNITISMPESMRAYLVHSLPSNYPTSADPLRASLEIVERQDGNSIISVLRHGSDCILIRNSENPFAEISQAAGGTGHCYLSSVWRKVRDSGYGQGLGQIIGSRQMVAQGTENLALEVLAYPLNPTFTRVRGWNTLTQNISLGTGDVLDIEGDDVRKGIGLLEMPKVPPEAWTTLQYNKTEALESAGANAQYTMGGTTGPGVGTGQRSGSGAQLAGQASASRLDGPVERFIRQVFTPWFYIMDNLNNLLLPTKSLREILTEKGVKSDINHVDFRNAQMKYEVLAGAHLGPKREMIQFLAVIEQIAINPALLEAAAQADMKFNFATWFKTFAEMSGFKFSQQFFVAMTDEEKKRRDANSAAGIAAQRQQQTLQVEAARANAKDKQIFDSGLARAGEKVVVLNAEHALQLDGGNEPLGTETPG